VNELALFAGAGGGILGGKLLGWRTVCAVERDAYAAQVLAQRQNDGILEPFPIWSDVTTFDGKQWRGIVDVISGGFPCQDISSAGKGAGITGERSGLWSEFKRIIGEVRPHFVFVENSPMLTIRGLGTVLGDLATLGFDAGWGVLSAADVGAPHLRERIWILAYAESIGHRKGGEKRNILKEDGGQIGQLRTVISSAGEQPEYMANTYINGLQRIAITENSLKAERTIIKRCAFTGSDGIGIGSRDWWSAEPALGRVANGVAFRVDRLKAIGNGQVPRVAATAFHLLSNRTHAGNEAEPNLPRKSRVLIQRT
jgi:DNA (cytosine-5)-methyltransferase 1